MRILFAGGGTGGHLYPGLAIARAVQQLDPDARPFFIGARRGIERDVLPASGFPHRLLDLHPLYRARPWENWRTIVGFARAWREIGALAREERPAVVVGTGGYAAAATCAWAAAHGVSVALQEQNSFAGITARLIARVASEIYLGYAEAARSLAPAPRRVDGGDGQSDCPAAIATAIARPRSGGMGCPCERARAPHHGREPGCASAQ